MKQYIPFAITPSNRSYTNNKDSLLLNCFIEMQGQEPTIIKRPGFNLVKELTTIANAEARGFIWCAAHNKYYLLIGSKVVSISSDFATVTDITAAITINTSTGKVYPTIFYDSVDNAIVLFHIPKSGGSNSQLLKIVNATPSVLSLVTDVDYPTSAVGAGVSFSNYYFVVKEDASTLSRRIYNSDINNIDSWTASNYVLAEEYPDGAVTLAKLNNQLVCLKENTIEFFYDAGNALGSPLSKVNNATLNIGCATAETVIVADNKMLWMSTDPNSGLGVHQLTNGKLQKISTVYIDKILASTEAVIQQHKVSSFFLTFDGHEFYGISIEGVSGGISAIPDLAIPDISIPDIAVTANSFKRTLVYDLTENLWHEWSSNDGTGVQEAFFCNIVTPGAPSGTIDYTNTLAIHKTTGDIYSMSPEPIGSLVSPSYKDGNNVVKSIIVTNIFDGGTQEKKRCNSLEVVGDKEIDSSLNVSYTDDDFVSWSNNRIIDLSISRSRLNNLGSFRRRAFKFIHEVNTPLRLKGFEIDIEKGSN